MKSTHQPAARHQHTRLDASAPVYPSHACEVLSHGSAYAEFVALARTIAIRKGLEADEVRQMAALRMVKSASVINDHRHWVRYSAAVISSCCNDAWRQLFRHRARMTSLEMQNEFGALPVEMEASLCVFQTQLEGREQERVISRQHALIAHLLESACDLEPAGRRVLEVLVESSKMTDAFKKNGRLNANAIARTSGVSQSTISRQLPAIRAAAAKALVETDEPGGMEM